MPLMTSYLYIWFISMVRKEANEHYIRCQFLRIGLFQLAKKMPPQETAGGHPPASNPI